jgi:hypothetical protein
MTGYRRAFGLALLLTLSFSLHSAAAVQPPSRDGLAQGIARDDERFWKKIATAEPPGNTSTRQFFSYALALCESHQHLDRLERLFQLAQRIQERNPKNHGYGNIKWSWRDPGVTDENAIDFCMHDALRLWLVHRRKMPEAARQTLHELMRYGIEGCLRHRVATSYTNITTLNAGSLIGLGEALDRADVAAEGYRRFDAFYLYTWQYGIHEYCSPTYYTTDLSGLLFVEERAQSEQARRQARALLTLWWSDIALNWFPGSQKFGGAQSRSYNYLYGLGGIDTQLWLQGWLKVPTEPTHLLTTAFARWSPPAELHRQSVSHFPRLVRQSWGMKAAETRTYMAYPDVALSTAGAFYGSQDLPLTIDLPGSRDAARSYFIGDGREDPYGRIKYETSGGAKHMKALHLSPFWAAAQQRRDALALAVYHNKELNNKLNFNVQSHLVLRRDLDGFWLRGRKIEIPKGSQGKPARIGVEEGDALVLRLRSAAVGIRVLWTRRQDGRKASIALVSDGNKFGVVRLTVEHRAEHPTAEAGAAFWIRIGSGLAGDKAFDDWRTRFEAARPTRVEVSPQRIDLAVPGEDGAVAVSAQSPFGLGGAVAIEPAPTTGIFELDGKELGRPLLASVEPARSQQEKIQLDRPLAVPPAGSVAWEAEDGLVFAGMVVGTDEKASGKRFIWQPIDSQVTRSVGFSMWPLEVARAGRYYLWARTLAVDPKADSFALAVADGSHEIVTKKAWHLSRDTNWLWQPLKLDRAASVTPLELPAGRCYLQLYPREAGAKIDRFMLTADPQARP